MFWKPSDSVLIFVPLKAVRGVDPDYEDLRVKLEAVLATAPLVVVPFHGSGNVSVRAWTRAGFMRIKERARGRIEGWAYVEDLIVDL